jgi:hypothetical protein
VKGRVQAVKAITQSEVSAIAEHSPTIVSFRQIIHTPSQ